MACTMLRSKLTTSSTRNPAPFTASRVSVSCVRAQRRPQSILCQAATADEKAKPAAKYHPSPMSQAPPTTYAIVEVAGHQMFVEPGKWYTCNRLSADVGSTIKLGRVLALKNNGKLTVGMPYLENVNVEAEVQQELRGPKVIVYKMKPKKHYRKKMGHRQNLSKFMVTKIEPQ